MPQLALQQTSAAEHFVGPQASPVAASPDDGATARASCGGGWGLFAHAPAPQTSTKPNTTRMNPSVFMTAYSTHKTWDVAGVADTMPAMLHRFSGCFSKPVLHAWLVSVSLTGCAGTRSAAPASKTGAAATETIAPAAPGITTFSAPYPVTGSLEASDQRFTQLIDGDAHIEKLAEGFRWSEGPIWVQSQGFLLFTDVPASIIYRWDPKSGVTVFMSGAGFHGEQTDSQEPGANGLAFDAQGRLLMCQHGDRRVARLDNFQLPGGSQTALASQYQGKRLNSPNDLAVHKSGAVFFTDPPYGLPKRGEPEPSKELPYSGVFRVDVGGQVALLHADLERPNGIALSPDEKTLYVANSHDARPIVMAFELGKDLSVAKSRVFFDATELVARTGRKGGPDGMAVDEAGNIFAAGPGGVLVLSPRGELLGTILTGQPTANCKFGDDGKTLYITSKMNLLRVRTKTRGLGFAR